MLPTQLCWVEVVWMEQSIGRQGQIWFMNAGCWVAARQEMQGSPKATGCPQDSSSIQLVQSGAMAHATRKRCSLRATGAAWRWRENIPSAQLPSQVSALGFMGFRLKRQAKLPSQPHGLSSRRTIQSLKSSSAAFRRVTSSNTKSCLAGSRIDWLIQPVVWPWSGPHSITSNPVG